MLKTCFVIQRFDGGAYDRRYRETFAPAIERAGAKPIRADEVLGTRPVVEKIEEGLRSADVAFAEVSEDNPNVFLELGFALALGTPTVIACNKAKRSTLPFDIAHRPISFYATESQSDYEKLSQEVEAAVSAALLETRPTLSLSLKSETSSVTMDAAKSTCLLSLLDLGMRSAEGASLWDLQKDVASAGMSDRMVALAVTSLVDDNLAAAFHSSDNNGNDYRTYDLTESGRKYLLRSYSALMQNERNQLARKSHPKPFGFSEELDNDVPF